MVATDESTRYCTLLMGSDVTERPQALLEPCRHAGRIGVAHYSRPHDVRLISSSHENTRKRAQEQLHESEGRVTRRRPSTNKRGVPPLSLWECGIGAVWK